MPNKSDNELLREYVGSGSESAFTQIVHRHINLVYSVAFRFTGNSEDAQDVTQAVFVILARKAAALRPKTIFTGWLYETTRFTGMNFLTHKSRRQAREQEAYMQSILDDAEAESIWRQLAPLLEMAMGRLSKRDRTLVALRFFENKSIAETAGLMGMNEWAARKRVERTLEKLRAYFSKRGIASTAAAIAGAISANSIQAAPAALIKPTTAIALTKGATASISTSTLIKGALKLMAWTKAKTAIVIGVGVLLAAGTTTVLVEKHIKAQQYTITREPWSDAGAATPKAALQSLVWALTHDKFERAQELVQWDEKGLSYAGDTNFQRQLALMSVLAPALKDIASFRILSIEKTKQPDELIVKIQKSFKENRVVPVAVTAKLRRVGGEWRAVGNIEYYESNGVSMLLPFTGSF